MELDVAGMFQVNKFLPSARMLIQHLRNCSIAQLLIRTGACECGGPALDDHHQCAVTALGCRADQGAPIVADQVEEKRPIINRSNQL